MRGSLRRAGRIVVRVAILAGLGGAAYAIASGLDAYRDGKLLGERAAVDHLLLYPLAAIVAASLLIVSGVILMYCGEPPDADRRAPLRRLVARRLSPRRRRRSACD
jgi:hypothetical protein